MIITNLEVTLVGIGSTCRFCKFCSIIKENVIMKNRY